jgi:hypothetical protein
MEGITLTYLDIRYIRDTLKEAAECDDIDDVRFELKECQDLLEEYMI